MKPTPKNIGCKFAKGYWVNMLAEEYKINEAHVECQIMTYIRNLQDGKYKIKRKRVKL